MADVSRSSLRRAARNYRRAVRATVDSAVLHAEPKPGELNEIEDKDRDGLWKQIRDGILRATKSMGETIREVSDLSYVLVAAAAVRLSNREAKISVAKALECMSEKQLDQVCDIRTDFLNELAQLVQFLIALSAAARHLRTMREEQDKREQQAMSGM